MVDGGPEERTRNLQLHKWRTGEEEHCSRQKNEFEHPEGGVASVSFCRTVAVAEALPAKLHAASAFSSMVHCAQPLRKVRVLQMEYG